MVYGAPVCSLPSRPLPIACSTWMHFNLKLTFAKAAWGVELSASIAAILAILSFKENGINYTSLGQNALKLYIGYRKSIVWPQKHSITRCITHALYTHYTRIIHPLTHCTYASSAPAWCSYHNTYVMIIIIDENATFVRFEPCAEVASEIEQALLLLLLLFV